MRVKFEPKGITFRLYHDEGKIDPKKVSIFDMISASAKNPEPKQTKALAYMLSTEAILLDKFLNLIFSKKSIPYTRKLLNAADIEVIAEQQLKTNKKCSSMRADIIIRIKNGKSEKVILIEAKSIRNARCPGEELETQIAGYREEIKKQWGCENIIAVALTMNKDLTCENVISITWDEIINIVAPCIPSGSILLGDYFNFLTNLGGSMKFYEKEVLSIPAGDTYELVKEHGVYICPEGRANKQFLFMTFRAKGGLMTTLYRVNEIYSINLDEPIDNLDIIEDYKKQIKEYLEAHEEKLRLPEDKRQTVYVLDKSNTIQLPNVAKPEKVIGLAGIAYYSLSDMLDPVKSQKLKAQS